MRKSSSVLIVCAFLFSTAVMAQDPSSGILHIKATVLKDLAGLGGKANAMNAAGMIVGYCDTGNSLDHAVLWRSPAQPIDLGTLGGSESQALGINNRGDVVGFSRINSLADERAFLIRPEDRDGDGNPDTWFRDDDRNGVNDLMLDLGTLGGKMSMAMCINDSGVVAGNSTLSGYAYSHIFRWENGQMIQLEELCENGAIPHAINERGEVVGLAYFVSQDRISFHAAYWDVSGNITDLGDPFNYCSDAWDINDNGLIVGTALKYEERYIETYPTIWVEGAWSLLDERGGGAYGANDFSEIVGSILSAGSVEYVPALWQNRTLVDLTLFENPGSRTTAEGINDLGFIFGNTELIEEDFPAIRIWREGVLWRIIESSEKAKARIDAVREKVDKLAAEDNLTPGQAQALKKMLDEATKLLEGKVEKTAVEISVAAIKPQQIDIPAVVGILKAFIHHVEAFIKSQILTAEDGEQLIRSVQMIVARLGG